MNSLLKSMAAVRHRSPDRAGPMTLLSRAGFTLIEVMLAVAILGMVISAVYATWNAAITGWRRGTAMAEEFQRQRIVMEMLTDLAQSAVFFTSRPELYEVKGSSQFGLGDSVSFVTTSDRLLPQRERIFAGLRRVTLALQREPRGGVYLAIANAAAVEEDDEEPGTWHVVSTDVIGFRVRYRNPRDGAWHDRWEEEPGLVPAALEFTVGFRNVDPKGSPLVVTRAVEFPTAPYALELRGQPLNRQDTTNTVNSPGIDLSKFSEGAGESADTE